jgi:ABC-2 type transport system ATP-binding protein
MPNDLLAAVASDSGRLPGLLPAVVPLLVLVLALDVYCLIDLARARSVRHVPKWVWLIVIVFISAPIGALAYLFVGRDRGQDPGRAPVPALAGAGAAGGDIRTSQGPAADGRAIVITSGLTRDYGGAGLFDVDLVVPRGSIYGLVGPNGAGKTTLLSLLSATRRPDRGTIGMHIGRHQIAVCPDVPEFDGWLTDAEVTDLARSLVAPAAGRQAVAAALAAAGLADSAGRRVGGFSRGMLQRLGLACALVGEPELLILDEPTSALDPAGRAEMLRMVAAMRGHRTVIFSSHILADVQRIADQVGILRDGRLLYQGATKDLIDTYLEPSWLVRIAGDLRPVAAALAGEHWATRAEPVGADTIRIDATSIEAGERGIPAVIAGCGARQVSCEPVAADLESAFLALTGASS